MEPTLGLLGGACDSVSGPGGTSDSTSLSVSKMEKDHMGMVKEASCYTNEAEVELGLGLSLSGGGSNSGVAKGKGLAAWGEYGRILTAKDFPNGFPSRVNAVSGTKRAAADCVSGPAEVGSPPSNGASQVVGWPPIGAYRMQSLVNQAKNSGTEEGKGAGANEKEESSKKKINHGYKKDDVTNEQGRLGFVKVTMDGLPIGRKVDLNAHSCYNSLAKTLEDMFFNPNTGGEKDLAKQPSKLLDGSSEFALTYEDKEGDWMLVGDVPWRMFLSTVKRLRIMKTSEANGLAPTFQETRDRLKGKPL